MLVVPLVAAPLGESLFSQSIDGLLRILREHLAMDVAIVSEFDNGKQIYRYVSKSRTADGVVVGDSYPLEDTYWIEW